MEKKKAIITGVNGQDGSYLSDLLLSKDYKVVGVARRTSTNNTERIKHNLDNPDFEIIEGDITDSSSITGILKQHNDVSEFYNLAAQSHVGTSFKQPGATWDITGKGCINVLQSIVDLDMQDQVKFYQASSSEMFGKNYDDDGVIKYQDEETSFLPQSPYAIAKCAAHYATRLYREAYGLHASAGILFNHESSRRGENFVTKKITKWIAEFDSWMKYYMRTENDISFTDDYIRSNVAYDMKFPRLRLGNLDAVRDWGHAADYVEAMWLMLQQEKPDDYVICTGKSHSVRDFLDIAFSLIGIDNWSCYVVIDPKFYRPAEVDYLQGRNTKAKLKLNWEPKMNFKQLVSEMVMSDICDIKSKSPWKDSTPV